MSLASTLSNCQLLCVPSHYLLAAVNADVNPWTQNAAIINARLLHQGTTATDTDSISRDIEMTPLPPPAT